MSDKNFEYKTLYSLDEAEYSTPQILEDLNASEPQAAVYQFYREKEDTDAALNSVEEVCTLISKADYDALISGAISPIPDHAEETISEEFLMEYPFKAWADSNLAEPDTKVFFLKDSINDEDYAGAFMSRSFYQALLDAQ